MKETNEQRANEQPTRAQRFPTKPYLALAKTVFTDAKLSNDMGVIADLLEAKAERDQLTQRYATLLVVSDTQARELEQCKAKAQRLSEALADVMEDSYFVCSEIGIAKAKSALAQYQEANKQ